MIFRNGKRKYRTGSTITPFDLLAFRLAYGGRLTSAGRSPARQVLPAIRWSATLRKAQLQKERRANSDGSPPAQIPGRPRQSREERMAAVNAVFGIWKDRPDAPYDVIDNEQNLRPEWP